MELESNHSEGQGDQVAAKKKLVSPFCVQWYSVLVEKADASAQVAELGDRTPRYQFPAQQQLPTGPTPATLFFYDTPEAD